MRFPQGAQRLSERDEICVGGWALRGGWSKHLRRYGGDDYTATDYQYHFGGQTMPQPEDVCQVVVNTLPCSRYGTGVLSELSMQVATALPTTIRRLDVNHSHADSSCR